jgi:hypothetical protein
MFLGLGVSEVKFGCFSLYNPLEMTPSPRHGPSANVIHPVLYLKCLDVYGDCRLLVGYSCLYKTMFKLCVYDWCC